MRKTLSGSISPIDDAGREVLSRVPKDAILSVEWKRPRNVYHHRKLFALLNLVWENQTRYKSVDALLAVIKVRLGHAELITMRDGQQVYVPKSISFSAMGQDEFNAFYDAVVKLVITEILPGVKASDLEREILDLCA